jgi:AraC-like DNA-binding protein
VAGFSPFHFHRQFSAYTGIGVGRLVQLFRLRRASMQLVFNPRASITDIAYDAGFANAESFSRAPCSFSAVQRMLIDCLASTPSYITNALGGTIGTTTVSSSRAGQTQSRTWP